MKKSLFTAVLLGGAFAFSAAAAVAQSASADQPAASPDALVQRQDALLEQMAELDSSAPDFQSQLRDIVIFIYCQALCIKINSAITLLPIGLPIIIYGAGEVSLCCHHFFEKKKKKKDI